MTMTETDITNFIESKQCWICEKPFYGNDKNRRVRDHCHFTGKHREAIYRKGSEGRDVDGEREI